MKVYGIDGDVARLVGPDGKVIEIPTARLPPGTKPGDELPDSASSAAVSKPPPAASAEDLKVIDAISKKYAALAPHMSRAAVIQSKDQGDGRQLEFYHPADSDNPRPGKLTFELYKNFAGPEREDAIAADALHYLGGHVDMEKKQPVDPKWYAMKQELLSSLTPQQRRIDTEAYNEEKEKGQTFEDWMGRNRGDAYVRAGLFPERNPEWQRPEGDPEGWTPQQRAHFARMREYLRTGRDPNEPDKLDGSATFYSPLQARPLD